MLNTGIVSKLRAVWGKSFSLKSGSAFRSNSSQALNNEQYWSDQNVTNHRRFQSARESLAYFHWRNDNYYDYLQLMPVAGQDGKVVLDYGCGPGNDLVGFDTYSKPARIIGMDISQPSLNEASERLTFHGRKAELLKISDDSPTIPLPDQSVDYIHCSGVLMCVADDLATLREFRRILRPGGMVRLMVYNYDSIWFHLFAGYVQRFTNPVYKGRTTIEAFFESTDWSACPMNRVWKMEEFMNLCGKADFDCTHLGNAVAVREVEILPKRFSAILDERLEDEHRRFLLGLTFDNRGVPYFKGRAAGIDACYLLRPR